MAEAAAEATPDIMSRLDSAFALPTSDGEPADEISREAVAEDAPAEAPEETENAEVTAESADAETEGTADEEAPEGGIRTIADLAKAMESTPEDVLSTLQVEGHDGKLVPLADVVRGYREAASTGTLPAALEAKRVEYERKAQAVEAEGAKAIGELRSATGRILQALKADEQIDWNALRQSDPSEYAARRADYLERMQVAEQGIRQLEADRARRDAEEAQARATWQREQSGLLFRAAPELAQPAKFTEAANMVATLLQSSGFDFDKEPHWREAVGDHRAFQILLDAARYRASKVEGTKKVEKVLKLGKGIGAQARAEKTKGTRADIEKARAVMRKRGGDRDSTIAVLERMGF